MRIHYLQHVPFEGIGYIQNWALKRGHKLDSTCLFRQEELPAQSAFDWLIVMGGPMGTSDTKQYRWLSAEKRFIKLSIENGKTILGICLGAQLIAEQLGGKIMSNQHKEIGWFKIKRSAELTGSRHSELLPDELEAFHWHSDTFEIPEGAIHIARSEACKNQGFIYKDRVVGLQFHLETTMIGIQKLIDNSPGEIVSTPYIQTAREILQSEERFYNINQVMEKLLDHLESAYVSRQGRKS